MEDITVNMTLLNEAALAKIRSVVGQGEACSKKAWLMGVKMSGGQTVAAYPGGLINRLAAPQIYITEEGADSYECNKSAPSKIVRKLRKHCKDPELLDAVKVLKKAVNAISK